MSLTTAILFSILLTILILCIEKWMPMLIISFLCILNIFNLVNFYGNYFTGDLLIQFQMIFISLTVISFSKIFFIIFKQKKDNEV